MQTTVTTTNVLETAAAIQKMATNVLEGVNEAFHRGGEWVTYESRDILRGQITGKYLPHYPKSISSEVELFPNRISLFVGPETDMLQGGMGPGIEFGSANTRPFPHLFEAFDNRVESILDRAMQNVSNWPA